MNLISSHNDEEDPYGYEDCDYDQEDEEIKMPLGLAGSSSAADTKKVIATQ